MASDFIIRKDANGQEISKKNNKNYHITFNNNIDIIIVENYKVYNILEEDENEDYKDYLEKKEIQVLRTGNENYRDEAFDTDECTRSDCKAISKGTCFIC